MRVATVVGTRPQLIKAAALQPALRSRHEELFIDTGQHWDDALAGVFFRELGLARPDHTLGVGGGSASQQLARMLLALEPILADAHPDVVVVHGDTNSTLAGTIAATSLGIPVAHVEAGLRSGDREMPEERNRIVVDHLSRWRFTPDAASVARLASEGIHDGVVEVGDLMRDLAARTLESIRTEGALRQVQEWLIGDTDRLRLRPGGYLYATVHRAENRRPSAVARWASLLRDAASTDRPVVLALHPGTLEALLDAGVSLAPPVHVVVPVGYRSSLALQLHAAAVVTDSGGVQREATWLGTPCLVLRETTEWRDLVGGGGAAPVLVGLDPERFAAALGTIGGGTDAREQALERARSVRLEPTGAAEAIVGALERSGLPAAVVGSS